MPAAKPPEFRRRAVDLVRSGQQPVARIASDLGISESCLRRWMAQDDVDAGRREGISTDERRELVELRRRMSGQPGQAPKRADYRRWERSAAMDLWQMDVVGGVRLVDGTQGQDRLGHR
ncbi:MAG: transposase [Cellulomonas sp.]|uniref:transposase n=1 Tax=Cellulomonas sp. 73-92 TaxID=1895740 RepID=UPI000AF4255F|nr:transposase [Cellulomonas sp. 73-92]MBN9374974.1 transposase [Cellulomonas sp.]